ncbi:OLC1v1025048C1 [Oldenlandia corymbosa var. corymbosa]|uniref:OLC1v1025048C1 n=1 Tax=Oldenlandia corymbosa var. corymbosa TaxID=529605 RepID=A0AAV1C445_OLDCO|nr:OLC1v1025048C1 [Oldenlandia corymbosa var. corymbosa]
MAETRRRSRKALKICCGVSAIVITIILVVFITLAFTVFKPKNPLIIPQSARLQNVQFQMFPSLTLNATLGLNVTVQNKNYGGFQFDNTTTYVDYRGIGVAEVPLERGSVPARGELEIYSVANISADKLLLSPYFWDDFGSGGFNFTSTTNFQGKANFLKVFKLKAKVFATCHISVQILSQHIQVNCTSKLKL